jgi:acyl-CoA synthetase (AMP-forming)/AMP-acid ligase II
VAQFSDQQFRDLGLLPPPARRPIPGWPDLVNASLTRVVSAFPSREALVGRYNRYTFAELEAAISAAAAGLHALGVKAGDRVAATAKNDPDIVIAFHAVQRLGGVWVGINGRLTPDEKVFQLRDCDVSLYLADAAAAAEIGKRNDLPALKRIVVMEPSDLQSEWRRMIASHAGQSPPHQDLDPFAPAAISYTSGTTGVPKGVVHSQHNMMVVAAVGLGHDTLRHGCILQLTIVNAMINHGLALLARGATLVCVDRPDAAGLVEWIAAESIEGFRAPPAVVYDLLTKPELQKADLSRLKYVGLGGAGPSDRLRELYRARFGEEVSGVYGLTEAPAAVTQLNPGERTSANAIGRAFPHLDIRILDKDDKEVPHGTDGEICVRATEGGEWPGVYTPMLGYWRRAEATRETLRNGWLHTGDIAHMDEHGLIFIAGRSKEMILRGGANVYPAEIEQVLLQEPRVREAVVVGAPDDRLGEIIVAVIQIDEGVDPKPLTADLMSRVAAALARYKLPDRYVFRTSLPRNAMGKIERHRVRQDVAAQK